MSVEIQSQPQSIRSTRNASRIAAKNAKHVLVEKDVGRGVSARFEKNRSKRIQRSSLKSKNESGEKKSFVESNENIEMASMMSSAGSIVASSQDMEWNPSSSIILHESISHINDDSVSDDSFQSDSTMNTASAEEESVCQSDNSIADSPSTQPIMIEQIDSTTISSAIRLEKSMSCPSFWNVPSRSKPSPIVSGFIRRMKLQQQKMKHITKSHCASSKHDTPSSAFINESVALLQKIEDCSSNDLVDDDSSKICGSIYNDERCQSCRQSLVLSEHSGFLRCANDGCRSFGRKCFVVDGDMSTLPFGAELGYGTTNMEQSGIDCLPASIVDGNVADSSMIISGETTTSNGEILCAKTTSVQTSLFNSSSGDGKGRLSDGGFALRNNDLHFKPVSIVFGYSPNSKAKIALQPADGTLVIVKANPKPSNEILKVSEGMIVYIEYCLCRTICNTPTKHECQWKGDNLCITEVNHVLNKIAKETSSTGEWKKYASNGRLLIKIFSALIKDVPEFPSELLLARASQMFVIARSLKDLRIATSAPHIASSDQMTLSGDEIVLPVSSMKITKTFKAGYVWYKIFQLIQPNHSSYRFFSTPTNKTSLKSLDKWWFNVCEMCGWQFIPTSIVPNIATKASVVLPSELEFNYYLQNL